MRKFDWKVAFDVFGRVCFMVMLLFFVAQTYPSLLTQLSNSGESNTATLILIMTLIGLMWFGFNTIQTSPRPGVHVPPAQAVPAAGEQNSEVTESGRERPLNSGPTSQRSGELDNGNSSDAQERSLPRGSSVPRSDTPTTGTEPVLLDKHDRLEHGGNPNLRDSGPGSGPHRSRALLLLGAEVERQ